MLKCIRMQLRKTASYAIDPEFEDKLYRNLLKQFREHFNKRS